MYNSVEHQSVLKVQNLTLSFSEMVGVVTMAQERSRSCPRSHRLSRTEAWACSRATARRREPMHMVAMAD
jgi:hypothetical protein